MAEASKEKRTGSRLFSRKRAVKQATGEAQKLQPRIGDYSVLLTPVITEKSSLTSSAGNTVIFRVDRRASKTDIRNAVERIFKVEVTAVRTCNYLGKPKRAKRSVGRRAGFKKAFISLKQGQTIDLVEGL